MSDIDLLRQGAAQARRWAAGAEWALDGSVHLAVADWLDTAANFEENGDGSPEAAVVARAYLSAAP